MKIKENELYQELDLYFEDVKIGEAEIEIKNKTLSRIAIFEPYQGKGYGTKIVKLLVEKYGCNNLLVKADNKKAIHVYAKCGFNVAKSEYYQCKYDG